MKRKSFFLGGFIILLLMILYIKQHTYEYTKNEMIQAGICFNYLRALVKEKNHNFKCEDLMKEIDLAFSHTSVEFIQTDFIAYIYFESGRILKFDSRKDDFNYYSLKSVLDRYDGFYWLK